MSDSWPVITRWRGAIDRCYALHQSGPGDLLYSHADAEYWWKLASGDWAGLCAACCAEWRQFMPAPLRITDNRFSVFLDMLEQAAEAMIETRTVANSAAVQVAEFAREFTKRSYG